MCATTVLSVCTVQPRALVSGDVNVSLERGAGAGGLVSGLPEPDLRPVSSTSRTDETGDKSFTCVRPETGDAIALENAT